MKENKMKTAKDILNEKGNELICVDENATIFEALEIMAENKIGAILVKKEGKIAGIWTERDLTRNSLVDGFDVKGAKIKDYMVTNLKSVPAEDTAYQMMDHFLGLRLRHLLIEENEEYIGMLSAGDVMRAALNEKDKELKELNTILSWEYYENWQWRK
jgi:signal-transduction protein with cAMP-binding, CBS, and nucleotidyltransferase domain